MTVLQADLGGLTKAVDATSQRLENDPDRLPQDVRGLTSLIPAPPS
jgi:hypothetical protein